MFADRHTFLVKQMEKTKAPPLTEMILVQKWIEELKRRVSTGNGKRATPRSSCFPTDLS